MQDQGFKIISKICEEYYRFPDDNGPLELAIKIMEAPGFSMHNYAHHYLVPAVLITVVRSKQHCNEDLYLSELHETEKRALNVLPAFCGLYGACGAAVGTGIFMSVLTGTTPLSKDTWSMCNLITSETLKKIADIGGPRCCKRGTFIAIQHTIFFLEEHLSLKLKRPENVKCNFSKFNLECLKENCPYYKK